MVSFIFVGEIWYFKDSLGSLTASRSLDLEREVRKLGLGALRIGGVS